MKYNNKFYKDIEKLSYHVYKESKYEKPDEWYSIKVYENKNNGFYAEAFENKVGQKVLVCRGTDTSKGINEMRKDLGADLKLWISKVPQQAEDAYKAYLKINTRNNTDDYTKKYSDDIFTPSNRVFYENEMKIKDMDDETLKQFVNQYYDDNYKFPKKEELDRRTNFGELIYVEDYEKGNGTKVNGY